MKNEQKFWRNVLESLNPDWRLHVPQGGALDHLADYDVHVYAIDTSTGWVGSATLKSAEFTRLAAAAATFSRTSRRATEDVLASIAFHLKQDPQPAPDAEGGYEILLAAAANLTTTDTFGQAKAKTGGVAGHWLYVVYRLADGRYQARPAFLKRSAPGLIPGDDLQRTVLQIVAIDTNQALTASVNRKIAAGGGAILCESLDPRQAAPAPRTGDPGPAPRA